MKRRAFITLVGGAVICPFAARAEKNDGVRRVGSKVRALKSDCERFARAQFSDAVATILLPNETARDETGWYGDMVVSAFSAREH